MFLSGVIFVLSEGCTSRRGGAGVICMSNKFSGDTTVAAGQGSRFENH